MLAVAGDVRHVDLLWNVDGLEMHAADDVYKIVQRGNDSHRLVEAVVAPTSDLVGYSAKQTRFRAVFNAAIVALHRHGERINDRIGDIALRAGDTLLLVTGPEFVKLYRSAPQFSLVSEVRVSLLSFRFASSNKALVRCDVRLVSSIAGRRGERAAKNQSTIGVK